MKLKLEDRRRRLLLPPADPLLVAGLVFNMNESLLGFKGDGLCVGGEGVLMRLLCRNESGEPDRSSVTAGLPVGFVGN